MSDSRLALRSLKALADYIGCTMPTAQRMKNNNEFKYYQSGRKFWVYIDELESGLAKGLKIKDK
jgi:hypothetical protein